jgi:hypothetical protein
MVLCFSQVGQGMNLYRYRMSQGGKMLLVQIISTRLQRSILRIVQILGNTEKLKEMLLSIPLHMQNIHEFPENQHYKVSNTIWVNPPPQKIKHQRNHFAV